VLNYGVMICLSKAIRMDVTLILENISRLHALMHRPQKNVIVNYNLTPVGTFGHEHSSTVLKLRNARHQEVVTLGVIARSSLLTSCTNTHRSVSNCSSYT